MCNVSEHDNCMLTVGCTPVRCSGPPPGLPPPWTTRFLEDDDAEAPLGLPLPSCIHIA